MTKERNAYGKRIKNRWSQNPIEDTKQGNAAMQALRSSQNVSRTVHPIKKSDEKQKSERN